MKLNLLLLGAIVVTLAFVDFLSFHDIFEPHSVKDYVVLVSSIFAFIYFAKVTLTKAK